MIKITDQDNNIISTYDIDVWIGQIIGECKSYLNTSEENKSKILSIIHYIDNEDKNTETLIYKVYYDVSVPDPVIVTDNILCS